MAITLKDLMDPLVKIAAATEKTAQKLDAVVSVVAGGAGSSLNQEIFIELQTQTNLLKTIAGNTEGGSGIKIDGKPVDKDKLKEGAEAIKMLGGGASSLAFGLLTFMLVPKGAVKKFVSTIKELITAFNEIDGENVQKGVDAVALMGDSLIKFAKGLVAAAIGSVIGIIFTPVIVLAMILISGAFALIGKMGKPVKEGAKTIDRIGRSLVFFSIGLVTFALASMFILMQPTILIAMVGTLVLIGGAVALLGIFDKSIKKGAVALFVVSLALIAFSIGYLIFAFATRDVTLEQLGIQAAVLVGVGIATGLVGAGFSTIIQGALGVAAMGLGLLIFSLGYLPFAMVTKDMTMESLGVQLAVLLGLGLEFAAAGVGALFIAGGAAAFAAVGASLLLLAPGLSAIKQVDFTQEDSIKLTTMLAGVKSAFLGTDGADEGFFSKVGGALSGAVDTVRMVEAAAGFSAAGIALKVLSFGLTAFKAVGWNDEMSKSLVIALTGITTAFALAGSSEQVPSSSFFGQMFGFKRTAVEEGISAVLGAGRALKDVASGLQAFQALIDSGVNFGSPDSAGRYEKGTLGYAVVNTIGFINEAFAAVADQGNVQAGGMFGSLFGIKQNKVAEGIESVKGAGTELTNIATGLKTFQELVDRNINWDTLGEAVSKSLGFVGTAFSKIGGMETEDSTGLSALFGISWDESSVQKGVGYVQGAGTELTNIATGLSSFQSMIKEKVNFEELGLAVKNTLMFVGDAFAIIGGKEQTDSSLFGLIQWDENLVNKGIENVKGAGTELINIAKGLQSFADLKEPEAVANSIKTLFTSIGDTFTLYYEKPLFKSQLDHMTGFVTEISNNAKNGYIDLAAKGMNDIAKAVNSIDSTKAESFANLFKGAGELTNNQNAFQALLEAVEDIREALAGTAAPNVTATVPVAGAQPAAATPGGLTPVLNNINATLARLNGTMTSLPGAISGIRFEIPE